MTKTCILNEFDTANLFNETALTGSVVRFITLMGNAILSSVKVRSITGSLTIVFEEVLSANEYKVLKTITYSQAGLDQFFCLPHHTQIRVTCTATGIADFLLKATVRSDGAQLRQTDLGDTDVLAMTRATGFHDGEIFDRIVAEDISDQTKFLEFSNADICQFQMIVTKNGGSFDILKRACEFFLLQENGDFLLQENSDKIKISGLIPI